MSKHRNLTVEISCRRRGAHPHVFKAEWHEEEALAVNVFTEITEAITYVLRKRGLLGGFPKTTVKCAQCGADAILESAAEGYTCTKCGASDSDE